MSRVMQFGCKTLVQHFTKSYCNFNKYQVRTFLSNAYYCREVWDSRLNTPVFQNIDLDNFYHELDVAYQKNRNISAVDVDIFANAMKDDIHTDELLDLVHKLRLSAESSNMLESTGHSVIRHLLNNQHYERLLQIVDDRLNYGVFLDHYVTNLLLDTFWKNKDYVSGAKIASQLMLQEDFSHPLNLYLSVLHSYKYLLHKPEGWIVEPDPEEPQEEIKIRVKFLRNPYFDDHFDLKEPKHLVGKTLSMAAAFIDNKNLSKTLQVVGLELYEKHDKAKELIEEIKKNNITLVKDVLKLLPEDNEIRLQLEKSKCEEMDVENFLINKVKEAEKSHFEKDIAQQCKLYEEWEKVRAEALEKQQKRLEIAQKLTTIEEAKKKLDEKELKLWFFDREEQLELDIEAKKVFYPKRWFGKKKKPRKADEDYVPPEVKTKYKQEMS